MCWLDQSLSLWCQFQCRLEMLGLLGRPIRLDTHHTRHTIRVTLRMLLVFTRSKTLWRLVGSFFCCCCCCSSTFKAEEMSRVSGELQHLWRWWCTRPYSWTDVPEDDLRSLNLVHFGSFSQDRLSLCNSPLGQKPAGRFWGQPAVAQSAKGQAYTDWLIRTQSRGASCTFFWSLCRLLDVCMKPLMI